MTMTIQVAVLINTITLIITIICFAFWLGRLSQTVTQLVIDVTELKHADVVPRAEYMSHKKNCSTELKQEISELNCRFDNWLKEWRVFDRTNERWRISIAKDMGKAQGLLEANKTKIVQTTHQAATKEDTD